MALENILKNIGTGILGLALLSNPCYAQPNRAEVHAPRISSKTLGYSLEEFKRAYGRNAWNSLDEQSKKRTEEKWNRYDLQGKERICKFYDNQLQSLEKIFPKEAVEEFLNLQSAFANFYRSKVGKTRDGQNQKERFPLFKEEVLNDIKREYAEKYPWVKFDNPGYDLGFIFFNEYLNGRLNPEVLKTRHNIPY